MNQRLVLALAQLNPTMGDVEGNTEKLLEARREAAAAGAPLMVASELIVSGYPPEDLVLKPAFQAACRVRHPSRTPRSAMPASLPSRSCR